VKSVEVAIFPLKVQGLIPWEKGNGGKSRATEEGEQLHYGGQNIDEELKRMV